MHEPKLRIPKQKYQITVYKNVKDRKFNCSSIWYVSIPINLSSKKIKLGLIFLFLVSSKLGSCWVYYNSYFLISNLFVCIYYIHTSIPIGVCIKPFISLAWSALLTVHHCLATGTLKEKKNGPCQGVMSSWNEAFQFCSSPTKIATFTSNINTQNWILIQFDSRLVMWAVGKHLWGACALEWP